MYRKTENKDKELQTICDIYNDITHRNRTVELHRWEWFESPYLNKSYVIVDGKDNILGHHGILTIKLNYDGKEYIAGKTENTIMKKEYGALYFKNEQQMNKEYSEEYDLLITTSAIGVIKKIREKLGYIVFSKYVTFIQVASIKFVLLKIKNKYLRKIVTIFSYIIDKMIPYKKIDDIFSQTNKDLSLEDLKEFENFYSINKSKFGISQVRDYDFLSYRLLNNPYVKYFILKLHNNAEELIGYLIYSEYRSTFYIDDIMYLDENAKQELLNRLFNYTKANKKTGIIFKTLENTILDNKPRGFIRFSHKNAGSYFMIKYNINAFAQKDLYFTSLMNEGIIH